MRRLALVVIVAGAVIAPATPAFAHGGDAPKSTAYRTSVTGISVPAAGLTVRAVEAGARLELSNKTGHSVEILGYSGEPYLDVRPGGTWQNTSSPAAYINETLAGDNPVPPTADPTSPPIWRKISSSTTVRWHDQRTHWLSAGRPPEAAADPGHAHRLREWSVPLRTQVTTYAITGTLDWVPRPLAGIWWLLAGLAALFWMRPVALIGGLASLGYAASTALDGVAPSLVVIVAGLLAVTAFFWRPPFYLALSGGVLAIFGGLTQTSVFLAAVLPAAGPAWVARTAVALALGSGIAMTVTGIRGLRAALPAAAPSAAGLSSSA